MAPSSFDDLLPSLVAAKYTYSRFHRKLLLQKRVLPPVTTRELQESLHDDVIEVRSPTGGDGLGSLFPLTFCWFLFSPPAGIVIHW